MFTQRYSGGSRLGGQAGVAIIVQVVRGHAKANWVSRWVFEYNAASPNSSYSAELDGLRGAAVIAVVLFHLDVPGFSGGWLGVDAFFVISGYLITRIISSDLERGNFSYWRFLLKRAKRLLPALAVVTLVTTVIAWATFGPAQLARFGNSVVGVAGYFSNITFMLDNGYFQQSAATTPLLHTWSLAVEEQFYIIFPLVLMALFVREKNWIRPVLFALTLFSLAAWLFLREFEISSRLSDWSFYLLPTRAWEFGVGALLGLGLSWIKQVVHSGRLAKLWAIGGAVLFLVALFVGGRWPDHGFPSLLMVISVALLILFAPGSGVSKFLSSRLMVGVGALSYGIYLWHFPLIAFAKILSAEETLGAGLSLLVVLATLVAAILSLRFVENPIRLSKFKRRKALALVLAFVTVFASLGLATTSVNNSFLDESASAEALVNNQWIYFSNLNERIFQERRLSVGPPAGVTTVIVGSSRMMQVGSDTVGDEVLNLSVSGASMEDIYALGLSGLHLTGAQKILIGIDPWSLHADAGQGRWKSTQEKDQFWSNAVTQGKGFETIGEDDIPSNGTELSLAGRFYRIIHSGERFSIPQNGDSELVAKKARDGSHVYSLAYASITEAEKVSNFGGIASYANMANFSLSEARVEELQGLIAYLQAQDVEVVLALSPYHPSLFADLKNEHLGYSEAEAATRDVADVNGALLIGSFDPQQNSCEQHEFYDGMHPKESCMLKVLRGDETVNPP